MDPQRKRWWRPNVEIGIFSNPRVWPGAIGGAAGSLVCMFVRMGQRGEQTRRGELDPIMAVLAIPIVLVSLFAIVWIVLVSTQWIGSPRLRFLAVLVLGVMLAIAVSIGAVVALA